MAIEIKALKDESAKHRALSERHASIAATIDALIQQLEPVADVSSALPIASAPKATPEQVSVSPEYLGMTQGEAIKHALRKYGPQTTRELFDRLTAAGMKFKTTSYVTAIMPRLAADLKKANDGRYYIHEQGPLSGIQSEDDDIAGILDDPKSGH